jgi:hypothetical protein
MTRGKIKRALREQPKVISVFKIIKVPPWEARHRIGIKEGDEVRWLMPGFGAGSSEIFRHLALKFDISLKPSEIEFVGYRTVEGGA